MTSRAYIDDDDLFPEEKKAREKEKAPPTLAEIEAAALAAKGRWLTLHEDLEAVEDDVHRALDAKLDSVIAQFLGFDNHWGRWEIDHCNGRAGESFIGNALRSRVAETAEKVVREILDEGKVPPLKAEQKKALIKDFRDQVRKSVEREMQRAAEGVAKDIVDSVLAEDEVYVRRSWNKYTVVDKP